MPAQVCIEVSFDVGPVAVLGFDRQQWSACSHSWREVQIAQLVDVDRLDGRIATSWKYLGGDDGLPPAPVMHLMNRENRTEDQEFDDECGTCGDQPGSLFHLDD